MQKVIPFLWFNYDAEAAMDFYTSVFKNANVLSMNRYGKAGPGPEGSLVTGTFEIEGQQFHVLNGGPQFAFTEAISLFVNCHTQQEVDELWEKLSEGGQKGRCGWLKDKFGISWQIIPTELGKLMGDKDPQKVARVMQAMMQMTKIDIQQLQKAYDG